MHCTRPRTVGWKSDGRTICWSSKHYSKEYATFQLPCGQCLECRLDYARQWAIRCVHEAQMYPNNAFVTLTYKNLESPKLDYSHFQKFMKRLRKTQNEPIGVFVTGEYGEKEKRPHWHAILFNYRPKDSVYFRTTERGDRVYRSNSLEATWGLGHCEFGDVTFQSAGYCARYAAKKLVHGRDAAHDYHPISKKSNKHAIGKAWLEKYWPDVFKHGLIVLLNKDGSSVTSSIPRYYEKWLKEHRPTEWARYVTELKAKKSLVASENKRKELEKYLVDWDRRIEKSAKDGLFRGAPTTRIESKKLIKQEKFKLLQSYLKL